MKAARHISSEDVEAQSADLVETCGQVEGGYNSNTTSTFANEWTAYAYFLKDRLWNVFVISKTGMATGLLLLNATSKHKRAGWNQWQAFAET